MITRRFQKGDAASEARYSDCETYRYDLTRVWDSRGKRVAFIMLNPSTATEVQNDPTVERCERRARALENVILPAVFSGRDVPEATRQAESVLNRLSVRIDPTPTSVLSRGERQSEGDAAVIGGHMTSIAGVGKTLGMVCNRADDHYMPTWEMRWKIQP